MKVIIAITAFIGVSAFCILDKASKTFKKMYGLQGTWKMVTRHGAICEEWKKVNDNYLQSKGYVITGNDTIINERVALTNVGDAVFYTSTTANQNNKKPIAFKLTKAENNSFVFENAQHDFPKRIVYTLISADSLTAFIDEGIDGSKKRQNFYYKKQ